MKQKLQLFYCANIPANILPIIKVYLKCRYLNLQNASGACAILLLRLMMCPYLKAWWLACPAWWVGKCRGPVCKTVRESPTRKSSTKLAAWVKYLQNKQDVLFYSLETRSIILWPLTAVGTHLRIKGQNFNFILKLTLNKICFTWLLNLVRNLVHHIGVWMVLNCPYTHLCRWAKFSSYPEKHSTLSKVCFTQLQNLARHQKCTNFLARFRSCVE